MGALPQAYPNAFQVCLPTARLHSSCPDEEQTGQHICANDLDDDDADEIKKYHRAKTTTTMASASPYFEKQSRLNQLCLVHALNMLLGEHVFTKQKLDEACETLSPDSSVWSWNPHRSVLGLGNYDVNVAMYILEQEHDLEVKFFDGRKTAQELVDVITSCDDQRSSTNNSPNITSNSKKEVNSSKTSAAVVGLLVNVPSSSLWFLPSMSRHWISYRPMGSCWWKLDSCKSCPLKVPTNDLLSTMDSHMSRGDYILIVQKKQSS